MATARRGRAPARERHHRADSAELLPLNFPPQTHTLPCVQFLTSQLPARLENHVRSLEALLPEAGDARLKELLEASAASKRSVLEVAQDWPLLDVKSLKGLAHFESHLAGFRERVEGEMARLMAGAQRLTESPGWWAPARAGDAAALNKALDVAHWYVLGLRLMLTQHSAALAALRAAPDASGAAASAGAAEAAEGAHPAHDELLAPPPAAASIVARAAPLRQLLEHLAEDVRAFCVEKNSAAPDVEVVGGEGLEVPLVVPYASFMFSEVLKNALQAAVNRHGAWSVDEADPVRVEISVEAGGGGGSSEASSSGGGSGKASSSSSSGSSTKASSSGGAEQQQQQQQRQQQQQQQEQILISITDRGLGIPEQNFANMFSWFWSSNRKKLEIL